MTQCHRRVKMTSDSESQSARLPTLSRGLSGCPSSSSPSLRGVRISLEGADTVTVVVACAELLILPSYQPGGGSKSVICASRPAAPGPLPAWHGVQLCGGLLCGLVSQFLARFGHGPGRGGHRLRRGHSHAMFCSAMRVTGESSSAARLPGRAGSFPSSRRTVWH